MGYGPRRRGRNGRDTGRPRRLPGHEHRRRTAGGGREALAAAVSRARQSGLAADGGAAVVLDVTNGDVLAMASAPDFDPSQLNDGLTEAQYAKLTDPAAGSR